MQAKVRSILKQRADWWRMVEGDSREGILDRVRYELAAAIGTALTASATAVSVDKVSSFLFIDGEPFSFPVEVEWADGQQERVVMTFTPDEVRQEIVVGLFTGALTA